MSLGALRATLAEQRCTLSVKVHALDDDLLVVKAAVSRPDDSAHCNGVWRGVATDIHTRGRNDKTEIAQSGFNR